MRPLEDTVTALRTPHRGRRAAPPAAAPPRAAMLRRGDRVAKSLVVGLVSTVATLASHLAAGGPAPGLAGVAVVFALSALVALPLSGRETSPMRLVLAVGASQVCFHWIFVLDAGGGGGHAPHAAIDGHAAHAAHGIDATASHSSSAMLLAHAVAGVVTVLALGCAEQVLRRVAAAARDAWRALRELLGTALLPAVAAPSVARIRPLVAVTAPVDPLLDWSGSRRGPPAVV